MNRPKRILLALLGPAAALVSAFLLGGVFMLLIGRDPLVVYGIFFSQTLGTSYGIGQILFKATPLMFTGLSAAICFRSGLFNIGAEGQLTVGALLTALVGCSLGALPSVLLVPACLLAGIAGGALWGAIPGFLKARFGAHEVINTIMMNFIAAGLASYLVINVFGVPATVHTPEISPAAELPRLGSFLGAFKGSPVNLSLLLALLSCAFLSFVLWSTRLGYELRVMGLNMSAAEYGHIHVRNRIVAAMAIGGGFAGLVGSNFVLGYKHYFEMGFSDGIGFIGIAVSLLANNHPGGIILTSLFFGTLEYGSLTINTMVPKELSNILQAIVIIFLIVLSRSAALLVARISRMPEASRV
jgi:ABC-type uncharacterized transport system permease subunit